jgi:hypothetical protein
MAESTVDLDGANLLFARFEWIHKSGAELGLVPPRDAETLEIDSVVFGYLRNLRALTVAGLVPGLGARLAGSYVPGSLGPAYGGRRLPLGGMIYVRVIPAAHPR